MGAPSTRSGASATILAGTKVLESPTGNVAKARAHMKFARDGFSSPSKQLVANAVIPSTTVGTSAIERLLAPKIALAEARIADAEGRVDEARRATMGKLPASAATVALYHAIAAADDGEPPKGLAGIEADTATTSAR